MRISTQDMTYCRQLRRFVVEASQVDRGTHSFWYDGLHVISHRTGCEAKFELTGKRVFQGEVVAWELIPTPGTLKALPDLKGVTVHVLNT